ncbi:MAG: hypothetical protein IID51_12890 [Proteobacteria bacterium]|nr:hypothetical protein [Pseudomonadota bacterium]
MIKSAYICLTILIFGSPAAISDATGKPFRVLQTEHEEEARWKVAGFDKPDGLIDAVTKIRQAANTGEIDGLISLFGDLKYPIYFNCEGREGKWGTGDAVIRDERHFQRVWQFLIEKTEFQALKGLTFEALGFNYMGASTSGGTLWITPNPHDGSGEPYILAINSYSSCTVLEAL